MDIYVIASLTAAAHTIGYQKNEVGAKGWAWVGMEMEDGGSGGG